MKKLVYLTASILALSTINANANTLANLLDDIKSDMIIVEKTGSCDRNPNLKNADGVSHSIKPCKSVVAQCPQGTTIIPGLSKCKMTTSAQDSEILSILKKIKGDSATLSSPDGYSKIITGKTLMSNNTQQCDVDGDGTEWTTDDIGYTSFCFFDLSKVEYVSNNLLKYAVEYNADGGLVVMQNKPANYSYTYPETFASLNNYSKITLSEFNNSSNYKCYTVNIKATARCLPTPDGFVKKLGLEAEKF